MSKEKEVSKEMSVAEAVAARIRSRSAKPVILDGKASRFDLRRYGDHDFTAGGQLRPRFISKSDDRIQQCISEGYDFPQNWDPRLPPVEVSGMVLMLRSTEHSDTARKWHLDNANALDRSKAPEEHAKSITPEQRNGAQFMSLPGEKPQNVVVTAENKQRVMGPE